MFNIWGSCWHHLYSNMVKWLWLSSSVAYSICTFFLGWFQSMPLDFLDEHPMYLASLMFLVFYCILGFFFTFSWIARLRTPCKESTSATHCLALASFFWKCSTISSEFKYFLNKESGGPRDSGVS